MAEQEAAAGIGYNQSEAKTLSDNLLEKKTTIKEKLTGTNWTDLQTSLETLWVGEDEIGFEKELAQVISAVYANTEKIVDDASNYILACATDWGNFIESNAARFNYTSVQIADLYTDTSTNGGDSETSGSIDNDIWSYTPIIDVADRTYDDTTTRGLQTDSASEELQTALDTYVSSIQTEYSEIFSDLNAASAFVGEQQVSAINNFIAGLDDALDLLVSMVSTFGTKILPQLETDYQNKMTNVATETNTAAETISTNATNASEIEISTGE